MLVSIFLGFASPEPAFAARSGGRMGGRAPTMRSAPRPAARAPVVNNTYNRGPTVIMGGPRMGYGGGYGYGGGMGYGGFGFSPFGYNPALSIGLTLTDVFFREQQRQAYLTQ
jgi:hypothetical protein